MQNWKKKTKTQKKGIIKIKKDCWLRWRFMRSAKLLIEYPYKQNSILKENDNELVVVVKMMKNRLMKQSLRATLQNFLANNKSITTNKVQKP